MTCPASIRPLLLVSTMLALSGCSVLGALDRATTPLEAYELRGNLPQASETRRTRLHVIVEPPIVGGALDTDRILIRPNRLQAQYLPDGRWTDTPAKMLQSTLVREIDDSGAFGYVGREPLGGGGDYAVVTEITDFQPEILADGGIEDHVRVNVKLVRERDVAVVAQRVFEVRVPASSTQTPQLISALDVAMARIVADITRWTVGNLS